MFVNKLDSKELYHIQFLTMFLKPTSQAHFENVFMGHVFEWNKIYILPRIATTDLQNKNITVQNFTQCFTPRKKLFQFSKISSLEYSFCKCEEETTIHLFHICKKILWMQLTSHLNRDLNLPHLIPQSAIFGFLDISNKNFLIVNHLLLLFKYYIYKETENIWSLKL